MKNKPKDEDTGISGFSLDPLEWDVDANGQIVVTVLVMPWGTSCFAMLTSYVIKDASNYCWCSVEN
jgi:hypothetical protein